jgi:thiosulfate reductase cytochrome b subunit
VVWSSGRDNAVWRQILALPKAIQNTRHVCLEGRSVVGNFGGARISDFLAYNPLQKLAYTSAIAPGTVAVITGLVLYKAVQLSVLAWLPSGFRMVRVWHFAAMLSLVSFIPGHLIMVALHGWINFYSVLIGLKQNPEPLTLSTHKTQAIGDLNGC